jgi:hypothetical protein
MRKFVALVALLFGCLFVAHASLAAAAAHAGCCDPRCEGMVHCADMNAQCKPCAVPAVVPVDVASGFGAPGSMDVLAWEERPMPSPVSRIWTPPD